MWMSGESIKRLVQRGNRSILSLESRLFTKVILISTLKNLSMLVSKLCRKEQADTSGHCSSNVRYPSNLKRLRPVSV
jgi:hypothetical protein